MKRHENKTRIIVTSIKDTENVIQNILHHLSVQLSDGYWEGYENFYEELWNWLEFDDKDNYLVVKIKAKPTWEDVKDIFSGKTDEEVIKYLGEVFESCYEDAPNVFEKYWSENIITETIQLLLNYSNTNKTKVVTLPCNIGDTIWGLNNYCVDCVIQTDFCHKNCKEPSYRLDKGTVDHFEIYKDSIIVCSSDNTISGELGKDVFLLQSEAETALEIANKK